MVQSRWNCCEITVNSFGKGRGGRWGLNVLALFCGNSESDIPQSFTSASSLPTATLCVETFHWSASSCVKPNTKSIQEAAILKKVFSEWSPQLFVIRTFQQSLSLRFCPPLLCIKEIFTSFSHAVLCQKHTFVHAPLFLGISHSFTNLRLKPWQPRLFFLCLWGTQSVEYSIEKWPLWRHLWENNKLMP